VAIDRFYETVESAYDAGGPQAAMESLIRAIVGDAAYEARDPVRRDRVLETADTYFSIEAEAFAAYMPDPADLAMVTVPTMVAAGSVDILGGGFRQSCEWVASHLGTTVVEFPGGHTPYLDHPDETAAMMQPFLRQVSAGANGKPGPSERRHLLHERTGAGNPIVLVPGGLSGWVSWIPHARTLSESHEVIRVQLRGLELVESGQVVPDSYAITTETDALLATVDALGLERFDLAGWSFGGLVALDFALAHPGRVRTLTLIEPAAYWILREAGYDRGVLDDLERSDCSLRGKTITPMEFRNFLVRVGLAKPDDDVESHRSWPIWMQNRQILASIGMIWDYDNSLDCLRELDVPILAVFGSDSCSHDVAIVRTLAATAPKVTLLELPGDHACHLQSGVAFLAALEAHLVQDVMPSTPT
jgi:pimeloyl-ACP methyl ester carboxylesterase